MSQRKSFSSCTWLFFFFQAEDGIRVIGVTGVQTCALPIWTSLTDRSKAAAAPATVSGESHVRCHWDSRSWEGGVEVTTREPGDLPSAVVTREEIGRASCRERV